MFNMSVFKQSAQDLLNISKRMASGEKFHFYVFYLISELDNLQLLKTYQAGLESLLKDVKKTIKQLEKTKL